ncbi:periplasmic binding protein-like II [Anaeromyces robustus]|uniref:Periplasmic binding protein-like II n=1 Tax=Anaeromyces robustus TaxID=1754192 RepID=A0A1Y1X2T9_9FUNG|nr:periplasmic binding protein-like II [Anaeromyces robustus]|eukprot:ORX80129.1 periplasmic binding protein-like II [Anaeromyces robustus]
MILNKIIFYIIPLLYIMISKCVTIDAIAFTYDVSGEVYSFIVNEFNKYSKENNLNVTLKLNLITPSNSTGDINDYGSMVEQLLTKKTTKYDLYFYDNIYSTRFGQHFVSLDKILDKEHINLYNKDVISLSCTYNGEYVGLPITLDYSVLYSNLLYLERYNKTVPVTWDELIETGKYIMEEEKKLNNNDLIIYNGAFGETEVGTCSLYEFIYSFRNKRESPFPELTDEVSIKALEKINEIKNEISSEAHFKLPYFIFAQKLYQEPSSFVFLKYWHTQVFNPMIKISPLPGIREGISGSTIGGYNLAISKYSASKKRSAVVNAFKYITSKDLQRKLVIEKQVFSLINSLYDEKEVCEKVDCDFYKSIQLIPRPTTVTDDYSTYSEQFRNKIYEYLFGEKSAYQVLSELENITKIYYITLFSDSSIGLIFFLIICISSFFMIASLTLLFIKKLELHFKFLSKDSWFLVIFGIVFFLFTSFLELGKKSEFKCQIRPVMLSLGFTLIYIPILYKLIINVPIEDTHFIITWIKNHRFWFNYIFIMSDAIICIIFLNVPYDVKEILVHEGKNYEVCSLNSNFGTFILLVILFIKIITLLCLLFLLFIEWNISSTIYDVKLVTTSLFVVLLVSSLVIIVDKFLKLNYLDTYIIRSSMYILLGLSNYILLYGIRILFLLNNNEEDEMVVRSVNLGKFSSNDKQISSNNSSDNTTSKGSSSYIKMLNYHFKN